MSFQYQRPGGNLLFPHPRPAPATTVFVLVTAARAGEGGRWPGASPMTVGSRVSVVGVHRLGRRDGLWYTGGCERRIADCGLQNRPAQGGRPFAPMCLQRFCLQISMLTDRYSPGSAGTKSIAQQTCPAAGEVAGRDAALWSLLRQRFSWRTLGGPHPGVIPSEHVSHV